jgi:hypothetical protein
MNQIYQCSCGFSRGELTACLCPRITIWNGGHIPAAKPSYEEVLRRAEKAEADLARLAGSLLEAQEKRAHFQVANFELLRKLDAAEATTTRLTGEREVLQNAWHQEMRKAVESEKNARLKAEADLARAIDAMEHHQRLEASYKESWQAAQADLARLTHERDAWMKEAQMLRSAYEGE